MATRAQFRDDIINLLKAHDPALRNLAVERAATSNGSTTTIVDTALGRGSTSGTKYDGRQVEVVESGHTALGEIAGVDDAGFGSSTTLTISPALSAAVDSGEDYRIYPEGYGPELVYGGINEVLRDLEAPTIWIPTLQRDGDFEDNDLTKWSSVGTPSTREFLTSGSFFEGERVLLGERVLHIVTDAADEGAQGVGLSFKESEQVLFSSFIWPDNLRPVKFELVDVASNTEIESASPGQKAFDDVPIALKQFLEARFTASIPAARSVRLRWTGPEGITEFYVSPPVIVQPTRQQVYPAPSWLTRESQISGTFVIPQGISGEDELTYAALSGHFQDGPAVQVVRRDRDLFPMHVTGSPVGNQPFGVVAKRTFDALSADTDTANVKREYMAYRVVANLMRQKGEPAHRRDGTGWRDYGLTAARLAVNLGYGGREIRGTDVETVLLR